MTSHRYVIMANGKGTRWGDHLGVPKQLIQMHGETLLERVTRQLHEQDPEAQVVISSANPSMETPGATRYEPEHNSIELDRFVPELIEDGVTFLYGDTFYTDAALARILQPTESDLEFFGNGDGIVAVKCSQGRVMREHLDRVRQEYLNGNLTKCIGWQVYQSYTDQLFQPLRIGEDFIDLTGLASGFNTPEDLEKFFALDGRNSH